MFKVGKWSADDFEANGEQRLYNHAAFVKSAYHWLIGRNTRWDCDDRHVGLSSGDFWKVFVR